VHRLPQLCSSVRLFLMRLWDCRFLPVLFSACLLLPARSIAQGQPAPQDTTARPLTPKELKETRKETQERTQRPGQGLVDGRGAGHHHRRRTSGVLGALAPRRNANNSLKIFWRDSQSDHESHQPCQGRALPSPRLRRRTLRLRQSPAARPTAVASTSSGVRPMKSISSDWRRPRSSY